MEAPFNLYGTVVLHSSKNPLLFYVIVLTLPILNLTWAFLLYKVFPCLYSNGVYCVGRKSNCKCILGGRGGQYSGDNSKQSAVGLTLHFSICFYAFAFICASITVLCLLMQDLDIHKPHRKYHEYASGILPHDEFHGTPRLYDVRHALKTMCIDGIIMAAKGTVK